MGFWNNLKDVKMLEEEVTHFEVYENGYYVLLRRGDRLDVTRAFNMQPPIENSDDYYSYLFAETQQGFFLMRLRVLGNVAQGWELYLEMTPEEPWRFYSDVYAHWQRVHKRLDAGG
ncbi:hypothetical protein ACFLQK_02865 [bacterium]